ncbi:hypothetical protein [Gluconobacter cerinus]|uniref:hypothetical protein n=1 Tax=Gluconobacter cerinus TaxID=38307 RepID=UPI001B8C6498|nr:hypothetical protein [Gluconobacter cerinus]MBS1044573.1 hypothetical protein [Gluconobacter cerinus]
MIYQILLQAAKEKTSVHFFYNGYFRKCSPHIIGMGLQGPMVLAYQYAGASRSGIVPEWRCFAINRIAKLGLCPEDGWHFEATKGYLQTCVKAIDYRVKND